jgi:hypothetical protein
LRVTPAANPPFKPARGPLCIAWEFSSPGQLTVCAYSETPNLGPRNPGPKKFRTNKFPDFSKNLHTITCVLQISDQQIPGVLVKITVLTRSGVRSFTVPVKCQSPSPSLTLPSPCKRNVFPAFLYVYFLQQSDSLKHPHSMDHLNNLSCFYFCSFLFVIFELCRSISPHRTNKSDTLYLLSYAV